MSDSAAVVAELLARFRADVDRALRTAVGDRDSQVHRMARYHLGWVDENGRPGEFDGGKRLRSTLCLLVCEAIVGYHQPALPAAAGLELIHNFTLVHDDVMDRDVLRRGRPSVWKLWGIEQAINAGDMLYAQAFAALADLPDSAAAVSASRLLADTCVTIVEGQSADLEFERRDDVTVDEYLTMISSKTAALIGVSLHLGALVAGAPVSVENGLTDLGQAMGIAFQIRDDMLGVWGDPGVSGKPVGQDLRRKKKTLPVLALYQSADDRGRSQMAECLSADDPSDRQIDTVLGLMEEFAVRDSVRALADEYSTRARQALASLPEPLSDRPEFTALIEFFTTRQS